MRGMLPIEGKVVSRDGSEVLECVCQHVRKAIIIENVSELERM